MKKITLKDVLTVIEKTLNSIDDTMVGHGEEVAYIMYKLLKADNKYSEDEMLKIIAIAMLHDIGAYKLKERKKIVEIDRDSPMAHAVYGSLFVKYFSPLSDLAPLILGHHIYPKDLNEEKKKIIPRDALLLHLADTIAILKLNYKRVEKSWIMNMPEEKVMEEHKKLFEIACTKYNLLDKIEDNRHVEELYEFLDKKLLTKDEVIGYIKMLTYAMDFRSKATVIHTITVEEISIQIAKILNLDEETTTKIKFASMLHDIGKIAIPVEILEKTDKLTKEEYEKVKEHTIIGYRILSDLGLDDLRDIAISHHEKLDGSGYPFKLKADEISIEARIVAIADIISALAQVRSYKREFSKEKIVSILTDMALNNKIDSKICSLVIENYDYIMNKVKVNTREILNIYNNLMEEYEMGLNYFKR